MGRIQDLLAIIRNQPDHKVVMALDGLLPRWIPASEQMPADGQGVIANFPSPLGFVTHAIYEQNPGWFRIPNYGAAQPTHWMPLPEPPAE